jgi:putative ABC transport system permease protein
MRSLYSLAWRNLTSRRLRTFLTGTAIALGVAAVFATSLIAQSVQARTASLAKQVSQADLQIAPRDSDTLDMRWLDVARAHPDVGIASPEVVHATVLLEPPGASLILVGVEPDTYAAMERVELASGRALMPLTRPWAVVPERWAKEYHVTLGGRLTLPLENGTPIELLVVGLLKHRDDAGAALRDRIALVPLTTLQDALGLRKHLTRIRIKLQPGREASARRAEASLARTLDENALAASNPVVVSKVDSGSNTDMLYGMMTAGLALTGAVILLAAALLIANTFAMNVTERTREIGILRSLGMDRGGVLRGVLVEATMLGVIGALIGLPLGWGLVQGIVRLLVVGQRLEWERLSLSMSGLIGAPLVGMGVAIASALWPARRASQVSPLAAIHPHRESRPDQNLPWTWVLGMVLLVGVMAVVGWLAVTPGAHTLDFGPVMVLCIAMALMTLAGGLLLLPPLVAGLMGWLRWLLASRLGVVGRLAGDQLAQHRSRTMLTSSTLAVGVAMIVLLSTTVGAMVKVAEGLVFGLMKEKLGVMAYSSNESFETSNPMSLQRQKEWPRGVLTMLDSLRDRAYVYGLGFSESVKEMEGSPLSGMLVLDDVEAFLRVGSFRYEQGDLDTAIRIIRRGRAVLVTPSVARRYNLSLGGNFMLTTKRGRVPFRVAAIGANPWWGCIVSRADAETYLGTSIPIGYFVTPRPGVETEPIKVRMQEGLRSFPQYKLFDFGSGFTEAMDISIGRLFSILSALLNGLTVLALVIASLGQINTMMASVIERVRELGVLRSVGLTREQVQRLILLEAAAVGVMGAIVGTLVGTASSLVYLVVFYTAAVEGAGFGTPTWASVSNGIATGLADARWIALFGLALAPLLTMLAAWLPARRAANLPIIEAIRDEVSALHRKRSRLVRNRPSRS